MLSLAATGIQMFGQIQQGRQEQKVFEYNAAVNRQKADLVRQAGDLRIEQMRREKSRFKSTQVAAYGAAGVRLSGSPLQVIADTATEMEMDILVEDYNTRVGVVNARNEADLDVMRGQIAAKSGYWSAGTTLLSQIPNFVSSRNMSVPGSSRASSQKQNYNYADTGIRSV